MQNGLFRKEALDRKRGDTLGSVRIVAPISQRYAMLASIAFAVCVIAWLVLGTYTRRVHVSGILVPAAGLIDVAARTPATITTVMVREGQQVRQGQPVVALSAERSSEALGATSASIIGNLRADLQRVETDIAQAKRLSNEQLIALRGQIATARQQISDIDGQVALQRSQIDLQQAMLAKVAPLLDKGFISAFQVQQQKSDLLNTQVQVKTLQRQRADTAQQLATALAQIAQAPMQLSAKISELNGQKSAAEQALASAEAERSMVLLAPTSGEVSSVLVKAGQAAAASQTLVSIVPDDTKLVAQLLVKSEAVGLVSVGRDVAIHLQAYPYQKFGVQKGVISSISRSAMNPQEVAFVLGQAQVDPEPLYRIDVALASQQVSAYGRSELLKAGMTLDADLLLDRRTLIEWMFEPLIGMKKRFEDHRP